MNLPSALLTGLLLMLAAAPNGVAAETIYKCGNHYGQEPCAGGKTLSIDDSRLPGQKEQHDAVNRRDAKLASEMEKSRLAKEQALRVAESRQKSAARQPHHKALEEARRAGPRQLKQPGRKPQDFTAVVSGSNTKSAKSRKTAASDAQ